MTSFARAMSKLTPNQQVRVSRALGRWNSSLSLGSIAFNLQSLERFLPRRHMKAILLVIQKSQGLNLIAVANQYKDECHRHVLKGGRVRSHGLPLLLGRVVERNSFKNHLVKCPQLNGNQLQAEDLVTRLLIYDDPLSEAEKGIAMSPYSAWVTWNESDGTSDPFSFSNGEASFVRACLGLDRERRLTGGLLLFTYTLGERRTLFRPTVADADLNPFFKPPAKGFDEHGWTNPVMPPAASIKSPLPISRPEALHQKLPLRRMRGRPRLLP